MGTRGVSAAQDGRNDLYLAGQLIRHKGFALLYYPIASSLWFRGAGFGTRRLVVGGAGDPLLRRNGLLRHLRRDGLWNYLAGIEAMNY